MNKIHIVKYFGGSYDDYYDVSIFATHDKAVAKKYVKRFNGVLKKWKDYYSQYESDSTFFPWISHEHLKHLNRWLSLQNITECYIDEIELR